MAKNDGGASSWSSVWSFTTFTPVTATGMALIPGGTFQMGSTPEITLYPESAEQPIHTVTVSSFYMDTTLVTQGDYLTLRGYNPSQYTGDTRNPVEQVTWFDAVLYCNARSKRDGKDTVYSYTAVARDSVWCNNLSGLNADFTKNGYRLPTEAEWEYACRAGTTTDYYWGGNYPPMTSADSAALNNHAVWYGDAPNGTQRVATKQPNPFGLYDMGGNVWEWCYDWSADYTASSQTNPVGPDTGTLRVLRGGAWLYDCYFVRASFRLSYYPDYQFSPYIYLGFRCVRHQ